MNSILQSFLTTWKVLDSARDRNHTEDIVSKYSFLCSEPKLYVTVAVFNDVNKGYIPKCWELLQLALSVNSTVCNFIILPIFSLILIYLYNRASQAFYFRTAL